MKRVTEKRRNFLLCRSAGQGVMEYIIITSLVGLLCLVTIKQFGDVLKRRSEEMKGRISKYLEISPNASNGGSD